MANQEAAQMHGQPPRAVLGDAQQTDFDAVPQEAIVRLLPDVGTVPTNIMIGEPVFIDMPMVNEGDTGNVAIDMSADNRYKWGTGGFMATGAWRVTTEVVFRRGVSTLTFRAGDVDFNDQGQIIANPVHDKVQMDVSSRSVGGLPVETVAAAAGGFAAGVFGTAIVTDQIQLPSIR